MVVDRSRARRVLRRVGFAVVAAYAVASVAFALVAATADPNVAFLKYRLINKGKSAGEVAAAVDAYRAARNLDEPLLSRYVRWMVDVTTFDWGYSFESGAPVAVVLAGALRRTLRYLVPGVLLSVLTVPVGVSLVGREGGVADRATTLLAYVAFGLPGFWLAVVLLYLLTGDTSYAAGPVRGPRQVVGVSTLVPALVVAAGTTATVLRQSRAAGLEYRHRQFVAQLRAKGAGPVRLTRHAFRNAAVPLFTLVTTELIPVLVLQVVVVETVLTIPGFGALLIGAIEARDLPVIVGATMVVAFVGIGGNLLQDLLAVLVDPRTGDR